MNAAVAVIIAKIVVERAAGLAFEQALDPNSKIVGMSAGQLMRWTEELVDVHEAIPSDVRELMKLGAELGKHRAAAMSRRERNIHRLARRAASKVF